MQQIVRSGNRAAALGMFTTELGIPSFPKISRAATLLRAMFACLRLRFMAYFEPANTAQ